MLIIIAGFAVADPESRPSLERLRLDPFSEGEHMSFRISKLLYCMV